VRKVSIAKLGKWYKGLVSCLHILRSSVCNFVYFFNICYNCKDASSLAL
jgi:hypothetical protein